MHKCTDSLVNSTILSTLDFKAGYWKIEIGEDAKDKTSFVPHRGLCRYKRMLLNSGHAFEMFQCAIDVTLIRVRRQYTLVYLDDFIVHSQTPSQQVAKGSIVLGLMKNYGPALNLEKCFFSTASFYCLGHTIRPETLDFVGKTTNAICRKNSYQRKQITFILGSCDVHPRFLPRISKISSPLHA